MWRAGVVLQNGRGKECLQRAASLTSGRTDGVADDEMRELDSVSRGSLGTGGADEGVVLSPSLPDRHSHHWRLAR